MRRYSQKELVRELTEHNDFFDMLVDMIPSKLYIAGNSGDDFNPRYHKGQSEESRDARKAAAKLAKRRKLDPEQVETTVELKKRLEEEEKGTGLLMPVAKHGGSSKSATATATANTPTRTTPQEETPASSTNLSRIEALREKLHAKIASLQNRPSTTPEQMSKRAARRAEKRRRAEKKAKLSNQAQVKSYQVNDNNKMESSQETLSTVDFGRLVGLDKTPKSYMETNKSLANVNKTKNLNKMLADAEAKRLKLQQLKQSADAKDQQQAAQMEWSTVLKEADGERVKDDPAKLKKALKRKAAKKAKSQKAWKARLEQQSDKQKERLAIRQHNLNARKQGGKVGANLSKKKIVTADEDGGEGEKQGRRRSRAGFEGRKQEFLNSGKE